MIYTHTLYVPIRKTPYINSLFYVWCLLYIHNLYDEIVRTQLEKAKPHFIVCLVQSAIVAQSIYILEPISLCVYTLIAATYWYHRQRLHKASMNHNTHLLLHCKLYILEMLHTSHRNVHKNILGCED